MPLSRKPIDSLSVADFKALVENGVPEGKTIDYKQGSVGGRDKDRLDFAKDVAAFANAEGGDIVFGIRERNGVAHEVVGLPGIDADAEITRDAQSAPSSGEQPQIAVETLLPAAAESRLQGLKQGRLMSEDDALRRPDPAQTARRATPLQHEACAEHACLELRRPILGGVLRHEAILAFLRSSAARRDGSPVC